MQEYYVDLHVHMESSWERMTGNIQRLTFAILPMKYIEYTCYRVVVVSRIIKARELLHRDEIPVAAWLQ